MVKFVFKKRVHLFISGRVQGVFFRAGAYAEAQKLGLTGWVRNTDDKKVQVVAEGEEDDLKKMIAWCQKGPAAANVESVEIVWEKNKDEKVFEVKN